VLDVQTGLQDGQFSSHDDTGMRRIRRGGIVSNGQSSLPSIGRRIRLDFFEFGETAKDFLDTNTTKSVLNKFRML